MENLLKNKPRTTFAHLCVIARHEMNAQPHAAYADIVEGVKSAASRARIPYHQVHQAIDAVVASTKYRFHDPTTERPASGPVIPEVSTPAMTRRPVSDVNLAVMSADGTVIRRSWESPSPQMAKASLPPPKPLSLGEIFQELAKRSPFTPERTLDEKAS